MHVYQAEFRCLNVMCAILTFKGINIMPFNHCPNCHLVAAQISPSQLDKPKPKSNLCDMEQCGKKATYRGSQEGYTLEGQWCEQHSKTCVWRQELR